MTEFDDELCMPGDFMHNCAMHELPMLEVQSNAMERR